MMALRLARVATGRPRVAKMVGGYHGTHDASVIVSGRYPDPYFVPAGLTPGVADAVTLLPFNDIEGRVEILETEGDTLAAVIVEPILGGSGLVPARADYLHALRETTSRLGILLIFDEVVTFSYGRSRVQGAFEVEPDITTFGKAIGGGTPLGAFAASGASCNSGTRGCTPGLRLFGTSRPSGAARFAWRPGSPYWIISPTRSTLTCIGWGIACVRVFALLRHDVVFLCRSPAWHISLHCIGPRFRSSTSRQQSPPTPP
jgi:hypothetical protein